MRVLAAMSGGVDSAVAAARMVDAGHDVVGVHLALSSTPAGARSGSRGCCTLEDSRDARRAADVLGIPFYVWDVAEEFRESVVDDFVAEYAAGRTPNPCLRCNERIKFAAVLERARGLGFDAVVTGHYARLGDVDPTAGGRDQGRPVLGPHPGRPVLRRARDLAKDQSYVLATLRPDQLAGALFPLGDSLKSEVREEASRRGLAVARKPDSHDICFIPDGDTAGFLARALGEAPGPVVDALSGEELGVHSGAYAFTVGQRKGLRLGRPASDGRPRYVLSVEPVTRTVLVGPREALAVSVIEADPVVWHVPEGELGARAAVRAGAAAEAVRAIRAQYRAHGEAIGCSVDPGDPGDPAAQAKVPGASPVRILLDTPAVGVAPGQAVVVYAGDAVAFAGRIRP